MSPIQEGEDVTGDTEALVAAAVAGQPLAAIAAAAGVSISTVQRRLQDPDVKSLVTQVRAQHRQEAIGRLTGLRTRALERLADLLDSEDESLALRAATLVLATSTKLDVIGDLDQRLAAVEQLAGAEAPQDYLSEQADDDPPD